MHPCGDYTKKDVLEIIGMTSIEYDHLNSKRFNLLPFTNAKGKGLKYLYSFSDLLCIKLAYILWGLKAPSTAIRSATNCFFIEENQNKFFWNIIITIDNNKHNHFISTFQIDQEINNINAMGAYLINLKKIYKELLIRTKNRFQKME